MSTPGFRMILENVTGALVTPAFFAEINGGANDMATYISKYWTARQFTVLYGISYTGVFNGSYTVGGPVGGSGTMTWPFNSGDAHSTNLDPIDRWQTILDPTNIGTGGINAQTFFDQPGPSLGSLSIIYCTDGFGNWALLPYFAALDGTGSGYLMVASRVSPTYWSGPSWSQIGTVSMMGLNVPLWADSTRGVVTAFNLSVNDSGAGAYWQPSDFTGPVP